MDTTAAPAAPPVGRSAAEHRIFSLSAILFMVLAVAGFTGSALTRSRAGIDLGTPRFILHAISGFLWLGFYILQTQFILRGRVSTHQAWGRVGALLLLFLFAATGYMLLSAPGAYPEAPIEELAPALGMHVVNLTFDAGLVVVALALRRRPFFHKRIMYFVTVGLASTGFTRLGYLWTGGESPALSFLLIVAFLAVLFLHDLRRYDGRRRWTIPLLFGAYLASQAVIFGLLGPRLFTSPAWYSLLEAVSGRG